MKQIVVFGATGYTGRLVVAALTGRGLRPMLAGRSEQRLGELSQRYGGLDTAIADVTQPHSVRALVEDGDVLVSTVGPSSATANRRWRPPWPPGRTISIPPARQGSSAECLVSTVRGRRTQAVCC